MAFNTVKEMKARNRFNEKLTVCSLQLKKLLFLFKVFFEKVKSLLCLYSIMDNAPVF